MNKKKIEEESDAINESEVKELAEGHWRYVESICHKMYVDAFIHGFKHGKKHKSK